jgi:hypothetical protein
MAGGDVITKGASKRTTARPKAGTRAGGDVITKGATKKQSKKRQTKAGKKR